MITISGGDVNLTAQNNTNSTASAVANSSGGKVGVGASFALNLVPAITQAQVLDGAVITGANNFSF